MGAADSAGSPPPCGEGLGVGVVRCGDVVPDCATPLPQEGREQTEAAARLCTKLSETVGAAG
jgi:hypothetical protein